MSTTMNFITNRYSPLGMYWQMYNRPLDFSISQAYEHYQRKYQADCSYIAIHPHSLGNQSPTLPEGVTLIQDTRIQIGYLFLTRDHPDHRLPPRTDSVRAQGLRPPRSPSQDKDPSS